MSLRRNSAISPYSHEPRLRRRIAAGELPAFRSGRRIIRIRVSDPEKLLRRVPTSARW